MRAIRGGVLALLLAIPAAEATASALQAVPWWNTAFGKRQVITVTVGPNAPAGGYVGYTVNLRFLDTASAVIAGDLLLTGNDLHVVYWDGSTWTDLPCHVINFNTASTEVRFALAAAITGGSDSNYYLYYRNPSAGFPPAMTTTNVYRWYDDGSVDRRSSYTNGRVHATGPGSGTLTFPSSFVYDAANKAYSYDTTNDHCESLRRLVGERDVLVTYDLYQTGAYDTNMCSGPLARLSTDNGAAAVENATGFYMYMLCNSGANPGAAYAGHGDIGQNAIQNGGGILDGAASGIPQVALNAWHSVGLAAFGATPTTLKGWYVNAPIPASLGLFGVTATLAGSQSAGETASPGQAGLYVNQDIGKLRNILIRRYTEPEPSLLLGGLETAPAGGGGGGGGVPRSLGVGGSSGDSCGCGVAGEIRGGALLLGALLILAMLAARR